MVEISQKIITVFKSMAYIGLVVFTFLGLIGPSGMVGLFEIEEPNEEGLRKVAILIPEYVIYWTFGTIVLEAIDNFLSSFKITKYDNEPLTRGENRIEMNRLYMSQIELNERIAKLEAELRKTKKL